MRLPIFALLGCLVLQVPTNVRGEPQAAAVKEAVARGVAVLKASPGPETSPGASPPAGLKALVGLTLLECDVPNLDPSVDKLASAVRKAAPELKHTYSVALALLFLERLGDPADVPLVQALGVRLLAGQNAKGGWSYECPRPSADEVRRLTKLLDRSAVPAPKAPREKPALAKELQEQIQAMAREDGPDRGAGDNSNTQFAVLALWVAHRHGVPIDKALTRAEARFRGNPQTDGGWGYVPLAAGEKATPATASTASMTCAGLLALAARRGLAREPAFAEAKAAGKKLPVDAVKDDAVRNAFVALGTAVGQPGRSGGPGIRKGFYFLWSLERVAVLHGLKTVGGKDWYSWGAELLLDSQQIDGSWTGEWGADVDTCFALLFLKRADLARDLSAVLSGQVADPGEVTLRTGDGPDGKKIDSGIAPAEDLSAEAVRLRDELVRTPADKQTEIIDRYQTTKGAVYTEALASAIPRLTGPARNKARDALAERLTRMTAATLRAKLAEEAPEVRRAAALACGMKDDKGHIPDLIRVLDDPEPPVVRAAAVALQSLTGQKFGPGADASAAEKKQAVRAWKTWWEKNGGQ